MTLSTPRLDLVGVFDANYSHTFSFSYSTEQITRNRLIIKKNINNEVVYDQEQVGMRLEHIINPNVLQNNMDYIAQLQVFDGYGNSSNLSDFVLFSCYSTPEFYFSNINDDSTVTNANLDVQIDFKQPEGDVIIEYLYLIYDLNKTELKRSDTYNQLTSYTYYGLENMTGYYIRAIGKTKYGFNLDTGYIKIFVKYDCVPTNIALSAENHEGKIIISTNIIFTDYELDNDDYELKDGELTLTDNSITYKVRDIRDFTFIVRARNAPLYEDFITLVGESGDVKLSIINISGIYYCKLNVNGKYVIYKNILGQIAADTVGNAIIDTDSNALRTSVGEYNKTALVVYEIHCKNGLYSLDAYYQ